MNNLVKLSVLALSATLLASCSPEDEDHEAATVGEVSSVASRLESLEKKAISAQKTADQAAAEAKSAMEAKKEVLQEALSHSTPTMTKGGVNTQNNSSHQRFLDRVNKSLRSE